MTSRKITPAEVATLAYLAEFPGLPKTEIDELLAELGPDAREVADILLQRAEGGDDAKRMAEAIRKWRNSLTHSESRRRVLQTSSQVRKIQRKVIARR